MMKTSMMDTEGSVMQSGMSLLTWRGTDLKLNYDQNAKVLFFDCMERQIFGLK